MRAAGSNPRRRRLLVVAALALATFIVPATRANAGGVACSFAGGTATVALSSANGTLGRSGTAITLNGTPCETATVLNTDLIEASSVDGLDVLTIDLSDGPFAPGASDEGDGSSEIEFDIASGDVSIIGTADADHFVLDDRNNTGNLNADEPVADDDITIDDEVNYSIVDARDGDNVIETSHTAAHLIGGNGDDLFRNTDDGSVQVDGLAGHDVATYSRNTGPIQLLGDGVNLVVGDPRGADQQLSSIETARTTPLNDDIAIGDGIHVNGLAGADTVEVWEGRNQVDGGEGHDHLQFMESTPVVVHLGNGSARSEDGATDFVGFETIRGTAGDDLFVAAQRDYVLDGGGGLDSYSVANASHGMRVDLKRGVVSNGDRLDRIEAVVGSPFGDTIRGARVANVLFGRAGEDVIGGLAADDLLFGGNGSDHLDGGPGTDECHGGPGTDTLVSC
jgi:Ca2+-binding RTX toxin-like protein